MPNKDKIRKAYDLMNEHYDMGTPEEFEEQMNDAGNREIVFKTLQEHYRLDNAPDQNAFDELMGYGSGAVSAQHGVVPGGNVRQMSQQNRAELSERMKQQQNGNISGAGAQNPVNTRQYQEFKQGYNQYMQQGGVKAQPQQQVAAQEPEPAQPQQTPANYVEMPTQERYYQQAVNPTRPAYMQNDEAWAKQQEKQKAQNERAQYQQDFNKWFDAYGKPALDAVNDEAAKKLNAEMQTSIKAGDRSARYGMMMSDRDENPVTAVDKVSKALAGQMSNFVLERMGIDTRALARQKKPEGAPMNGQEVAAFDQMFEEEYNRMADALQRKIYNEYAKKHAPKNTLEYVASSMMHNSLIGTVRDLVLSNLSKNEAVRLQLINQGMAQYDANMAEEALAGAATMIADAPAFMVGGQFGNMLTKGVTASVKAVTGKTVAPAVVKGLAMVNNSFFSWGAYGAASGYANKVKEGVYAGLDAGDMDYMKHALQNASVMEALKEGAVEGVKGIAIGALGMGVKAATRNVGRTGRIATDIGMVPLEAASFVTMDAWQRNLKGEKPMTAEEMMRDYGKQVIMIGLLHGKGVLMNGGREYSKDHYDENGKLVQGAYTADGRVKKEVAVQLMNDTDMEMLQKGNFGQLFADVNDSKQMMEVLDNAWAGNGKMVWEAIVENEAYPMMLRARVAAAHGKMIAVPRATQSQVVEGTDNGGYYLVTYASDGKVLDSVRYETKAKAEKAAKDMEPMLEDQSVMELEDVASCADYTTEEVLKQLTAGNTEREQRIKGAMQRMSNGTATEEDMDTMDVVRMIINDAKNDRRETVLSNAAMEVYEQNGIDPREALKKRPDHRTEEDKQAIALYKERISDNMARETMTDEQYAVYQDTDSETGTVKYGTDSEGRRVIVKGTGDSVIVTDVETGETRMEDARYVTVTEERTPAEELMARKNAEMQAEQAIQQEVGAAPETQVAEAENAPVAEEELPSGALAEEGTPIMYYDENNNLVEGTYIGPDHMQNWKHVIKDKNGKVVSRRLDEDEILLPDPQLKAEKPAEAVMPKAEPAAPVTDNAGNLAEAPVAPENVNRTGTDVNGMKVDDNGMPTMENDPKAVAESYMNGAAGMSYDEAKQVVDWMINDRLSQYQKLQKKQPEFKGNMIKYQQEKAAWQQQVDQIKAEGEWWRSVQNEFKAREEAAKAKEEAIRQQMAAEEQARIDKIREEQLKETQELERKHREFMAELERKRQEQEALEAEQAKEELTGDQMAEQAVLEEQKRRERMRIGQRLAEVGQLTDLDQPADEAMAAQVAYLSPDFKVTPESLRLELGSNFGKFGREGMLRLADNNGRTISEIADAITQAAGYDENGQWKLDANKVREELIKCIQEGSAQAIEALEKRVGIGTQRPEDRPEYWTDEKIAEYEARQQQNQQMSEVQQQIAEASEMVNTSPTDAQKEAGNYKKGHVKLDGMEISIEQPKGSTRSGVDADGLPWAVRMNNTYGYIRGTKGKDKDHIDIFLSDNPEEGSVFVVDQIDPRTGEFDEHKVMYGFNSLEEAREAYLSNYMSDWQGLGNITEVNKTAFKVWLSESVHKTKPFADYRLVKAEQAKMGIERGYDESRDPFAADRTNEFLNGNEGLETIEEAPFRSILKPIEIPADMPEHMVKAGNDAVEMGKKLHTKVNICWDMSQIPEDARAYKALHEGKQVGGWYSAKDGEVYLYMPHLESPEEVMKTLLHETVAHRGMREMFGEDFETMLDNVYKYASEDLKKSIDAYWKEMGFTSQRQAVDEYIAKIAEEGPQSYQDKTLLSKVKGFIINALRKMGFDMGNYRLTDDDIRYMLAKSHDYMQYEKTDMESEYKPKSQIEKLGGEKEFVVDPFASRFDSVKPVGTGEFGNIYNQFKGRANDAVKFLLQNKDGEALGALHHDYVGEIDIVYGNDKGGLKKIARKHPEVLDDLQEILDKLPVTVESENKIKLEDDKHMVVISKGIFGNNMDKRWLLTAYEKKETGASGGSVNIDPEPTGKQNGTAPLQNTLVSGGKDTNNSSIDQENREISDLDTPFSIRKKEEPKKKGIGYKVFYRNPKDGKLYPPMVANPNGADTPVGVWLDADAAPIVGQTKTGRNQVKAGGKGTQGGSGQLAYRPGWHLGEIPYALQFGRLNPETGKKDLFPKDFVWAEVEYAADKDYQDEAYQAGINANGKYQHSLAGLPHLPEDGYYRYRTNPNPETDPWIITGAMKVNRVLSNDEVDDLVRKAGREPQKREPEGGETTLTAKNDEVKVWTSTRLKKLFKGLDGVDEQTKNFCSVSIDIADNINEVKTSLDKSYMGQPHVSEIKVTVPKSMTYEKDGEMFVRTSDINDAISRALKEASDFAKANERKMVRDESTIGTGNDELLDNAHNTRPSRYDEDTVKLDENNYVDAMYTMSTKYTNRVHDELQSLKDMVSYNKDGLEVNTQRLPGHVGQFEYTHIGQNDIVGYKKVSKNGSPYDPVYGRDLYKAQWEKLEKPMQEYKEFYERMAEKAPYPWMKQDLMSKARGVEMRMERMKQLAEGVEPTNTQFGRWAASDNGSNSVRYRDYEGEDPKLENVNNAYNEQLSKYTPENADSIVLDLGTPSEILKKAGVEDKPMKLYGSKIAKKLKKHGFEANDLRDLPRAMANPIAVFDNYNKEGNRSVLTELEIKDGNILVAIDLGEGGDIDFNIIASAFGKDTEKIETWLSKGYATYINNEKVQNYLHLAAPIAAASDNAEPLSGAKVGKNGELNKFLGEKLYIRTENFKNWFGDWQKNPKNASKVVDKNGEPLVVYHGTQLMSMYFKDGRPYVDYTERFNTFKDGKGFFTSDRDAAESFARGKQGFYEVYLDMKKPFVIDCQGKDWDAIEGYENPDGYTRVTTDYIVNDIKRNHPEYDGVIFKNVMNENSGAIDRPIDDYVPFKAEQIKSAVDNNGDFSRENKDIRYRDYEGEDPLVKEYLDYTPEQRQENIEKMNDYEKADMFLRYNNSYNQYLTDSQKSRVRTFKSLNEMLDKYSNDEVMRPKIEAMLKEIKNRPEPTKEEYDKLVAENKAKKEELQEFYDHQKAIQKAYSDMIEREANERIAEREKARMAQKPERYQHEWTDEENAENDDYRKKAKKHFGTTQKFSEAGYILTDGSMLDFTGRHEYTGKDASFLAGHRQVDHREIAQTEGLSTNMNDFIAHGNVRILPESGTINLSAMPTASQLKKIKEFVRYEGGDVSIEFSKVNGDSEHYVEYDEASGARIAADITRYYQEGIKPQTSTRFNRVYHGSAADFDAFDHKFMGSGEGSQVYGWGTYVSESDKVAKDYAMIAKRNADYDIQATKSGLDIEENQVLTRIQMMENRIKRAKASGNATEEQLNAYNEMLKYAKDELEEIKLKRQERYKDMNLDPKRRLYHVEIPDDNGKNYLDWNDAVSTDMLGRIKEEAAKEGYEDVADMVDYYTRNGEISGGDLYNKIIANGLFVYEKVKQADADKVASKLLNNAGIVGVKVPTNNMRGNGDKSKNNYVIFKESDAKIVSKEQFRRGEGVKPTVKSEEVTEAAKGMADKLHKEVKICQNADEISDESVKAAVKKAEDEGRTPTRKGWFNTRTGEIEVYAPAAESVEDVQKTVLHETVGHYGLRELLSENEHDYNNAMVEMYRLMNDKQKKEVLKLMSERKYDVATAMDEYLAKMAEDRGNMVEPGFWQKAKSVVKNLLRKLGIDVELTDGDLKYLLWSSHEALKNSREVTNPDGSKSRVYDRKTMDQKAADWAMRWHNDVLGLRSKWEAERKAEGRGTEATVQAEANVSEEQARKAAEEAVKNRDTDPDDDPTTPGGGGSPSPTGGREYTIEQKLNMEAMKFDKQLEEIQNETDKKAVGDRLLRFVKERMQPLTGKRMTSMDINGLISKIEHAKNLTRKSAMENALLDIDDTIVHAEVSAEVEDMLNKLNIKTQTSTKKGLVKGVLVDDTANRILTDIKASYQQMINTTADARMSEIRREIRKKMAEYGISRQDDPAMPEELKNAIAPLKQQLTELIEQKKQMQTTQQMETLDQLNEREQFIQAEIGNIAANGGEMSEAYTEELIALPIKKNLAEMRKLKSLIDGVPEGGGDNLNRALEKTSRNSELWTALMKEKVRHQRHIASLSRRINEQLSDIVGEGRDRRRAEVQEEIRREIELDRITCNALRMNEVTDQQKQKANETFWTSIKDDLQKMNDLNEAPTFSFNYLLKLVDMNHGLGDGELYAHFMKSERGALKANNNMKMGIREFGKNVDEMAEKIFGKGNRASALESLIADSDKRTGKLIYKLTEKSPDPNAVQQRDDRNMTKGEMLYMWLTWRQEAGKLKMMQAGWTERSISEMEEQMGEEYKQFGTWASDVFLPRLRADKYNQTYRKIYGTDMHAAKHYFPIRIDKTAIMDKSEVGMNEPEGMPVSGASNLIVRTGNTLPVDASVNAIEMLLDYGRKMERWNAMQDLVKDLNTIYRCKAVSNLMEANHKGMYEIFKNAANVATGNFDIDDKNVYDKIFGYLQRGGTGAAIRYGWYTALKQTLSAPAFLSYDDSWRYQAIRLLNQTPLTAYKNYQWAKENLPAFADRIADNDMGIEGLNEKTVLDILTGKVAKYGMMANKVVDACTVANGAYAIYKYDSERYKKMLNDDGTRKYTDEQAEDKAKVNAELAFNESQQSSRNEFSSPVQKSRSIVNKGATAFQNSNIGYRRMALEGYHDWERAGRIRDNRIAQAEKIADETARNKAIEEAKAYYWKMKRRGAMKMATVGILNAWWFMGLNPALTYRMVTMNGDDEDKDKFVKGMLMNVALGYLTNGTMLGPIISTGVTKIMNEEVRNIDLNPFMFLTVMNDAVKDVKNTLKNDDWGELSWAIVKNSIRAGGGVDLEKFDNMYDGIYDIWERGDVKRDDIFKILNMPKSQRKEFAQHDVDLPISEYIKNYMSADKRVNPGERGKAWLGGIGYEKELTDTKMNDILKMYMNNKVNGFFERKKQLDNLNKEARKLYKEMTGKDKEEKNYKPLEWDKAMKEVTKDDPDTQKAFLKYMNTAPDFKEKMTHSKKYDDLLKKLKDAVKELRAGKEGSQKKVDESMEKLIDLEKKIVKLWPEKK